MKYGTYDDEYGDQCEYHDNMMMMTETSWDVGNDSPTCVEAVRPLKLSRCMSFAAMYMLGCVSWSLKRCIISDPERLLCCDAA